MNRERVEQELHDKYRTLDITAGAIIGIVVDAVFLAMQDDGVVTGSLVVCPECKGTGKVPGKGGALHAYCPMCKGYGSVKVESNTPSA